MTTANMSAVPLSSQQIIQLPQPIGIVALWGFLLPTVYVLASSLTNLVFKDAVILKVGRPAGRGAGRALYPRAPHPCGPPSSWAPLEALPATAAHPRRRRPAPTAALRTPRTLATS